MISFAESTSIFVVGGENKGMLRSAEAIGVQNCSIPQLLFAEVGGKPSVILTNQNEILTCGGLGNNIKHCMVLKEQKWFLHSNLKLSNFLMPDLTMEARWGNISTSNYVNGIRFDVGHIFSTDYVNPRVQHKAKEPHGA